MIITEAATIFYIRLFVSLPNQALKLLMEFSVIKGIYGDEAHLFSLEQWVNVYINQCDRAIYYSTTQVKYLEHQPDYDLEDFLLEPIREDGEVMSVAEAKQCSQ
ncbi:MAG: hypothetical protein ACK5U6_05595 [Pseudanabaena sp.]|jgi:hypothetical protein